MLRDCVNTTCVAGAGSLLIEFGVLSRLLDDPVYEAVARRAVNMLWHYRSNVTGLFGQCSVILQEFESVASSRVLQET